MIPRLEKIELRDGYQVWSTTEGVFGVTLNLETCDLESVSGSETAENYSSWLRNFDTGFLAKFETSCELQQDFTGTHRAEALSEVGAKTFETRLTIQTTRNPFLELIRKKNSDLVGIGERLLYTVNSLEDFGLLIKPLSESETRLMFHQDPIGYTEAISRIDTGSSVVGAIRLYRQSAVPIDEDSVSLVLASLPPPFRFVTSLRRLPRAQTESLLQKRLKQESSSFGLVFRAKQEAIEEALVETNLEGREILEFETSVIIERSSERELREALASARTILSKLGDVIIEIVGVAPTFAASMPGAGMHLPLLESDLSLPLFLPIFRYGENVSNEGFIAHRRDDSLGSIDLLNRNQQNSNALILGASGRGKSALLGCLTESLLEDKSVCIIKVDVGGSHSNECELLKGKEYRLNLESNTGLNPFALIDESDRKSEAVRSVLSQFIEQLILEEGEIRLPKSLRVQVDQEIEAFLSECRELSIDSLLKQKDFPRIELLSRFGSRGIFGRAFRGDGSEGGKERLRYFNFQDIFQASDPDFAQGAMAAVLAVFNLELRRYPEDRLILICDETPFFVERCFDFFKLSTANVRKFGAAVILVAQLSKHLVVRGDPGLIENSHHRFLFSSDGDPSEFRSRLNLDERQFELLQGLKFEARKYSEFLYQTGTQAKAMRLRMSLEEYWRVSSTQSDRLKLKKLKEAVPSLTTEEAIRCLSINEKF